MNVVIDTLPHDRGGGITYLKNILPYLGETGDQYYLLVPESRNEICDPKLENVEIIKVGFPLENLLLRLFYQQIILPFLLYSLDSDVLYSPGDITTFLAPCPTTVAIRNPNPYFEQPNHTFGERIRYLTQRYLSRLSVIRSKAVIFVSNHSKSKINEYLHVPESKSHVIYHGINKVEFQGESALDNDDFPTISQNFQQYILCVSTLYKHKNYEVLIQSYADLPDELRDKYKLVIAGGYPDEKYFNTIIELVEVKEIEDNVVFPGRVDYELIPQLYKNAEVSVLPSKLETFGHPLVESMAAGTPVIASKSTCIPEITGDAALLFDPDNYEDLSEHIETVLTNKTVSRQLVSKGHCRVQDFSWERTAKETQQALRSTIK
jgi:glycosyltransferase involved in cell wall biosynthesis